MRKFAMLVFDEFVPNATQVFTPATLNDRLGSVDHLGIQVIADNVSGTSPTVTVQIQHSTDQRNWLGKNGTAEINASAISAAQTTQLQGFDASPNNVTFGFVRLAITLGGTSPAAHLKIYVTGRDDATG